MPHSPLRSLGERAQQISEICRDRPFGESEPCIKPRVVVQSFNRPLKVDERSQEIRLAADQKESRNHCLTNESCGRSHKGDDLDERSFNKRASNQNCWGLRVED